MLVEEAVNYSYNLLKNNNILNAKLDSELIVSSIINIDRINISIKLKQSLNDNQKLKLKNFVQRRIKNEPIAYILNKREFWNDQFYVNPSVLIPRPETEVLIDLLLKNIRKKEKFYYILDIGTGSGCVIISLLSELKKSKGIGIDISKKAISVAKINQKNSYLKSHLVFKVLNMFFFLNGLFDIIISNPPYLRSSCIKNLSSEIKSYEPKIAINGGKYGIDYICKIIRLSRKNLKINGLLCLEIGDKQFLTLKKIYQRNFRLIDYFKQGNNMRCIILQKIF